MKFEDTKQRSKAPSQSALLSATYLRRRRWILRLVASLLGLTLASASSGDSTPAAIRLATELRGPALTHMETNAEALAKAAQQASGLSNDVAEANDTNALWDGRGWVLLPNSPPTSHFSTNDFVNLYSPVAKLVSQVDAVSRVEWINFPAPTQQVFNGLKSTRSDYAPVSSSTAFPVIEGPLQVFHDGESNTLLWSAPGLVLEQAYDVKGPWTTLPGATSPFTISSVGVARFFRLRQSRR